MKRFTVIMNVTFDTGIGPHEETHAHRVKAADAKAACDAYAKPLMQAKGEGIPPRYAVLAVVNGWPEVSGVDHKE
jgi:hypothetical protein